MTVAATAVRESAIRMPAPMILAALAGHQSQVRLIMDPQPAFDTRPAENGGQCWRYQARGRYRAYHNLHITPDTMSCFAAVSPYGRPGDRLWVKECFALVPATAYRASVGVQQGINPADPSEAAVYRAGWNRSRPGRWRSSTHMPRWACRLGLEVLTVRVGQSQSISEADALASGIGTWTKDGQLWKYAPWDHEGTGPLWPWAECPTNARDAYARLLDETNGRGAWDRNAWEWVIKFRRIS